MTKIHKDCKFCKKTIGGDRLCIKTGRMIWSSFEECECEELKKELKRG